MAQQARHLGRSNLSAELTSFVGRRQELREVKRLLTTTRLLTLTGSGGAGKTRLALRAAADMSRGFPDGAWLVLLAPIQDPMLVPQAVFGALGVHDLSAGASLSSLAEYLAGKRLLLVLDNCEHLLDGCAVLTSTLLTSCPRLHVLATSRQALGVAGEVRMVVPPMSLPEGSGEISVEQVLACDAVWLLSERAAAVVPGFSVDAGNAAGVVELCRRLDGIPLALELAAVRLGSLSLGQLNQRLADELSVLGSGNRGAEARQQTLEATIGWSYQLLSEHERLLWARLSVFAGGFEEDAAAAVCADPRLAADQIVDALGALVDKSIVKRQLTGTGPPRYWLLETLRQYGRMRLRDHGEQTTTQRRHFDWICALAEKAGTWDAAQAQAFKRMSDERDNLWAALGFCLQHPDQIEAAARLAQHLMAFWACRGPFGDIRRVLASLAESAPQDGIARARLLSVAASMATCQNDYAGCGPLTEESLRIATEARDVEVVAWSLLLGAMPHWLAGDTAGADALLESALSLASLMHLKQAELVALNTLCGSYIAAGALDRAIETGQQAVTISENLGELWVRGFALNFLAQAVRLRGDTRRAETLAREAAACKHAIDDRNGLTLVLETLARIAEELGQYQRAARLLGAAEHARQESSLPILDLYRPQHERSVAAARHALGKTAYDAAFQDGRAMTIGEGVAFAVEGNQPSKAAPTAKPGPRALLTSRQLDVARLVADGLSNKQIADRLFLSERTVEAHITNILNKLGFNSRTQISHWMADLNESGLTAAEERP